MNETPFILKLVGWLIVVPVFITLGFFLFIQIFTALLDIFNAGTDYKEGNDD